jgi:hypothetical protein
MKKKLLFIFFIISVLQANTQTLHLMMVSDYANPTFGKITLENEVNIEMMFGRVAENLGYKTNKIYLNTTNKSFNQTAINARLSNLKPLSEDIIVFYYNGFGFYPPNNRSDYPVFQLSNSNSKTLYFDDVARQLSLKNNRLGMVIADIRNTQNRLLEEPPVGGLVAAEQLSKVITRKLFLEKVGIYKILSAKKGMPSYPYFTESFVDGFDRILEISESERMPEIDFDFLIDRTQSRMNAYIYYSENKSPQEIQWVFTKLNKRVKSYEPPYFNIPTPKELKAQIELLINPAETNERLMIEQKTRELFSADAMIEVVKVQADNSIISSKITIDQYIKQTAGYDKTIKRTVEDFRVFDFRRTADFKKFTELRITEKNN